MTRRPPDTPEDALLALVFRGTDPKVREQIRARMPEYRRIHEERQREAADRAAALDRLSDPAFLQEYYPH
jgi:hypothetical protein